MHDGVVVVPQSFAAGLYRVFLELLEVLRLDVLLYDCDVLVSVWSRLLVPVSKGVAYLMHDGAQLVACGVMEVHDLRFQTVVSDARAEAERLAALEPDIAGVRFLLQEADTV